jgi:hypothetical protein
MKRSTPAFAAARSKAGAALGAALALALLATVAGRAAAADPSALFQVTATPSTRIDVRPSEMRVGDPGRATLQGEGCVGSGASVSYEVVEYRDDPFAVGPAFRQGVTQPNADGVWTATIDLPTDHLAAYRIEATCLARDKPDGVAFRYQPSRYLVSDGNCLQGELATPGAVTRSPVRVRGISYGAWEVRAAVLDANGKELGHSFFSGGGDIGPLLIPFEGDITFSEPTTPTGTVRLQGKTGEGGPGGCGIVAIPVMFTSTGLSTNLPATS